jgi:hypothetical protein
LFEDLTNLKPNNKKVIKINDKMNLFSTEKYLLNKNKNVIIPTNEPVDNLCTVKPYEFTKTRDTDNKETNNITKELLFL